MRFKNRPLNAARFSQGGRTTLLAATTERNKAAAGSATEDDGSDVLNRQPYAQPFTKGAALAAVRTVIAVRSPHLFRSRITSPPAWPTVVRRALSQPLNATKGRLASTTRALRSHTVVVGIPLNCQSDRPAFAAGEFASLGVEVGFTHGRDPGSEVGTVSGVQRLPVPLLRPLDRVRISFSVTTLLRGVSALLIAESLALVSLTRQRRKAVQAPALASKTGPAFKIGVEVVISPSLRILGRSECPRRKYPVTLKKKPRDSDGRHLGRVAVGERRLDRNIPHDRSCLEPPGLAPRTG